MTLGAGTIATVAEADGAAGWCVMIVSTSSSLAARLAPEWASAIFGDPASVAGGVFAPNGTGTRRGRAPCERAVAVGERHQPLHLDPRGTQTDGGEFHLMFAPASDVELLDTWYSSGFKGTGSTDFGMTDVFVPDGRSVQPFAGLVRRGRRADRAVPELQPPRRRRRR